MLHSKTIIVDRRVGLIGSANLDRRSFELNFENNILFADAEFASEIRERQEQYRASSNQITAEDLARVGVATRVWQNLLATMSPVL
jgi:cardiolipin synthase